MTAASGTVSTTTLKVAHGLCRQIWVKANTDNTKFRVSLKDEDGDAVVDYGFQTGILNDLTLAMPIRGQYTLTILNASADDTFKVKIKVHE